ncbi:MAG: 50S ribosomal protein L22 [Acidimicrobiales bacterium]
MRSARSGAGVPGDQPGTRAIYRHCRMSASKVREVLELIRGQDAARAAEVLELSERQAAVVVGKVLASAVANAENNDSLVPEELYVSECFADEGPTIKRWRARARGRASSIKKRTCHITVVVTLMPEGRLARSRAKRSADAAAQRARRVAGARRSSGARSGADRRASQVAPDSAAAAAGRVPAPPGSGGDAAEAPPAEEKPRAVGDGGAAEGATTDEATTDEATTGETTTDEAITGETTTGETTTDEPGVAAVEVAASGSGEVRDPGGTPSTDQEGSE